jgi:hypothetical protein
VDFEVNSKVTGPLFDGTGYRIIDEYIEAAQRDIAEFGHNVILLELATHLRHPTGYYESRVKVEAFRDPVLITDGGVIYGPWLEGVGSRNAPVTRFKGYASFRRSVGEIRAHVRQIGDRVLQRYLGRLG